MKRNDIISGIEDRNFEYGNFHKLGINFPKIYIEIEDIVFKDVFSMIEIYQSYEFNNIVKIFEAFGVVKKEVAVNLASDFVISCLSLRPIPAHCKSALDLRSEIIRTNVIMDCDNNYPNFMECLKMLSNISDFIFDRYCDEYWSALEAHMAFHAEKISA